MTMDFASIRETIQTEDARYPLRAGRLKIGWDLERMAANAVASTGDIKLIEAGYDHPKAALVRSILEQRGVRFDGDKVIGPEDPEALTDVWVALSGSEIRALEWLSDAPVAGKRIDVTDLYFAAIDYLWREYGLVQKGSAMLQITYDGEVVTTQTDGVYVRLSKKGRALLKWQGLDGT
jgi:hypothetical protein